MKVALLDLYEGTPNMGMKCIQDLVQQFAREQDLPLQLDVFDVRSKAEVPDLSYDVYISSGGPGSPLDSEGSVWEQRYFGLMDQLLEFNQQDQEEKKYVFLICHSFQIFCRYYGYGSVTKRLKPSFGIYPVNKTEGGRQEPFFGDLPDPFWIADFRTYQVTNPNQNILEDFNGEILALEKERLHVPLERALMTVRFTPEIFGTQFHPEADPEGMVFWFQQEEKKKQIIEEHGEEKYYEMLEHLADPDKIAFTQRTIIPAFLANATLSPIL